MGRWAQRRRAGGGPTFPPVLISITLVVVDGANELVVTYSGNVDPGDFSNSDFITDSSLAVPTSITDLDTNILLLTFGVDVSDSQNLVYSGNVSGVLTPQSVAY